MTATRPDRGLCASSLAFCFSRRVGETSAEIAFWMSRDAPAGCAGRLRFVRQVANLAKIEQCGNGRDAAAAARRGGEEPGGVSPIRQPRPSPWGTRWRRPKSGR